MADAFGERRDALVRRRTLPAQRKRDLALALDQVEGGEVGADRLGKRSRVNLLFADEGRLQHLEIAPRQELARLGNIAGIAGELHAVLRGTERSSADTFAGRQERPRQRAGIDADADRASEPAAHVAEVAGLAAVDIFADAAGEHDAVDPAEIEDRIGEA